MQRGRCLIVVHIHIDFTNPNGIRYQKSIKRSGLPFNTNLRTLPQTQSNVQARFIPKYKHLLLIPIPTLPFQAPSVLKDSSSGATLTTGPYLACSPLNTLA